MDVPDVTRIQSEPESETTHTGAGAAETEKVIHDQEIYSAPKYRSNELNILNAKYDRSDNFYGLKTHNFISRSALPNYSQFQ